MSQSNYLLKYPYYVFRDENETIKKEIRISRIKLINEKINFSNKTVERTYSGIKTIFENGIFKKLTKIIFIVIVLWHFTFGLPIEVKPKLESQVSQIKIERIIPKYSQSEDKAFSQVSKSDYKAISLVSNSTNPSKHGPGARGKAKAMEASAAKAAKTEQLKSSQTRSKSRFSIFAEALTTRVFPNRPGNGRIGSHPATSLSPNNFGKAQGGARITQCSAAEREIEENGPLEQSSQPSSQEQAERIQQSIERSYQKPSQKDKKMSVTASNGKDYNLVETRENHQLSRHGDAWDINDPVEVRTDKNGRTQVITRINKENRLKFRENVIETLQNPESQIIDCRMRGTPAIGFHTTKFGGKFGCILVAPTEGPFSHDILKAQPLSALQWSRLQEFGIID